MNLVYSDRVLTFSNDKQSFDISFPDGTIAVAVSGGLDSTALIYLVCKYITDLKLENKIKVKPIHSVCKEQSNSLAITQSIIEDVYIKYPNINIDDLEVFYYSLEHSSTSTKSSAHNLFHEKLYSNGDLKLIVTALTALPSKEIIDSWDITYVDEKRIDSNRDVHVLRRNGLYNYKPFINVDKKMIANLHEFLELDKKYVSQTWTCTRYAEDTKTFTQPCGKCYHCWEKKWAFGQF